MNFTNNSNCSQLRVSRCCFRLFAYFVVVFILFHSAFICFFFPLCYLLYAYFASTRPDSAHNQYQFGMAMAAPAPGTQPTTSTFASTSPLCLSLVCVIFTRKFFSRSRSSSNVLWQQQPQQLQLQRVTCG